MLINSLLFLGVVWLTFMSGVIFQNETPSVIATILLFWGLVVILWRVSLDLEGVLQTFSRFFATGAFLYGLSALLYLLKLPDAFGYAAIYTGNAIYILSSVLLVRFLLSLNPASGVAVMALAIASSLILAAVVHLFVVFSGSSPQGFGYWIFLALTALCFFFGLFYFFSIGWTRGGIWSGYFLMPFTFVVLCLSVYTIFTALGLEDKVVFADVMSFVAHSVFLVSMVRLAQFLRTEASLVEGKSYT